MNLAALLALEKFSYLKPLNRCGDAEREVATVESTETPDIQAYVADHALIITTAMYYVGRQDELIALMDNLQDKACCGIAIKVDRFLGRIEPHVLAAADERRFPLLLIPPTKTLGEVYQDILMHIWQENRDELTFALNSQKMFSSMLVQNSGLRSLLATLSQLLQVETALLDPFGNIEYSGSVFARMFDKHDVRALVKGLNTDVHFYSGSLTDQQGETHVVGIYLMRLTAYYPYYLLVLNHDSLAYPVASFIIDQAILSLTISLNRDLDIDYQKLARRESRFRQMLKFCARGDDAMILDFVHAEKIAYVQSGRTAIIYFSNFQTLFPAHLHVITYTLIYNWFAKKLAKQAGYYLYPLCEEKMYLVQTGEMNLAVVVETLNNTIGILRQALGIELNLAVGSEFHAAEFQEQSYREALNAIQHGILHAEYPNVRIARPQDFRSLFAHINDHEIDYFCLSVLGELYYDDIKAADDYRETLRVWLMNKSDLSKTAREMFIHRNTVSYRLDRCKEILQSDLSDPMELFNLAIALNLRQKKAPTESG